jgi:hypothetical protein
MSHCYDRLQSFAVFQIRETFTEPCSPVDLPTRIPRASKFKLVQEYLNLFSNNDAKAIAHHASGTRYSKQADNIPSKPRTGWIPFLGPPGTYSMADLAMFSLNPQICWYL